MATPPMKRPVSRKTAEEALTEAAQSLRLERSGLRPTRPQDLIAEASHLWAVERKKIIDAGARRVLARVSPHRIDALYPVIDELVYEQGWDWETPTDEDKEELREFVAWGIACLRWEHWTRLDPTLDFMLNIQDAREWLAKHHPPRQLCLFGGSSIESSLALI
jgi:hypothetical protein